MGRNKIALSVAHYPGDKGAGFNGFYEHDESILWTSVLRQLLEKHLPPGDVIVAPIGRLGKKIEFLNRHSREIAIGLEIHFNSSVNKTVAGHEVLYCPGSVLGERYARELNAACHVAMGNRDRGVKEGWYRMDRPGVKDYEGDVEGDEKIDAFLIKTLFPAVIVEPEFISQKETIQLHRVSCCGQMAQALLRIVGKI